MDLITHTTTNCTCARFLGARNVNVTEEVRETEPCESCRRRGDSVYESTPLWLDKSMWTAALKLSGQFDSVDDHTNPNTTWCSLQNYTYERASGYTQQELRDLWLRMDCKILPNGMSLTYKFMPGADDDRSMVDLVPTVVEAYSSWSYGANIEICRYRYEETKNRGAHIRICITENESVSASGLDAAFAYPYERTMLLENTHDAHIVLHEFGHALGLQHEHQRCIKGLECNADAARKYMHNFPTVETDVIQKLRETRIDPFEYDPNSVMHYEFGAKGDLFLKTPKQPTTPDVNIITEKDHKLMAHLYPLPVGNDIGPMPTREWTGKRPPQIKRRTISRLINLPHPWSSTPRIILGMHALEWTSIEPGIEVKLMTSKRNKRSFELEAWGNKEHVTPSVSYLALDPQIWNVQTSSYRAWNKTVKRLNPDMTQDDVELYWLRENTAPDARVVTWFKSLTIPNTKKDFEIAIDHRMDLTLNAKQLALQYRATSKVTASTNWTVINPEALNIDGGNVTWKPATGNNECFCEWAEGLFPDHGFKTPNVTVGINGLKYHYYAHKHRSNKPVCFDVKVTRITNSGFYWCVETCHRKCFEEIKFSWVVVPQPVLTFGFPKGRDRPVRCVGRKPKMKVSCLDFIEEVRDFWVENDLSEEMRRLFDGS